MNKEYDFTTMSDKDVFSAKLKGDIRFGYISAAKRAKFLRFCADAGILKFIGEAEGSTAYKVVTSFVYSTMGDYRPVTLTTKVGDYMIYNVRSRPNAHVKEEFSNDKKEMWLKSFLKEEEQ